MAQGIKTIDTIGQQLPTLSLVALLHCLVLSRLDYSAIFLQQINATLMLSLEKQLNWALKRTYFRSKFTTSSLLRISKSFIGIEKRIELKCICDIRPEWPKCNLCRLRIFSSKPSELMISKD